MNYLFGFSGRFGRLNWWSIQLIMLAAYILFAFAVGFSISDLDEAGMNAYFAENGMAFFGGLFALFIFCAWINLAGTVKRYHDRDKSGFWYLIVLIPFIGAIWQLIECGFLSGTPGGNSYGTRGGFNPAFLGGDDDDAQDIVRMPRASREIEQPAPARQTARPTTRLGKPQPAGFGKRGL